MHAIACLLAICLLACTSSLNWRTVQLGQLSTLLPCKPDNATRVVSLAGLSVSMEMSGCEADGVLFAISRIQALDADQAGRLMAALRQASLAQVQTKAIHPVPNSGDAQTSFDVQVDGKRPDGSPLQARFKWLVAGTDVYQLAAYGAHLGAEQTEPLLSEARFR
jgi:hypothetical protein